MSEKPILYMRAMSPGCRSVLMCAAELGIELEQKIVDLAAGENKKASFIQLNPQNTIPMLDDNGVIVIDSHAICAYLCEKYAETDDLYPKDLVKRAVCDARLHFDSGHLFARLRFLIEPIVFAKSSEMPDDRIQNIQTAWDILERFLENNSYVCGDEMTIADFCLVATASSITEIVPLESEKHLKIMEWMDRMSQLPYYDEINGTPAKEFQAFILSLIEKNASEA